MSADAVTRLAGSAHDLSGLTTLGVPARAQRLIVVRSDDELAAALDAKGSAVILGGGSNVLLTQASYGTVVLLRQQGISIRPLTGGRAAVTVAAGENWHEFVMYTLRAGYCGLENLALIYGSCGAAPIQNIGAYGSEVSRFITSVRAMHRTRGSLQLFSAKDCRFGYRDSFFKTEEGRSWIVCEVEFELASHQSGLHQLNLEYPELAAAWSQHQEDVKQANAASGTECDALQLAQVVAELRRHKLPDPAKTPNAGSFFKNPVVEEAQHATLQEQLPGLVSYSLGKGRHKLAAAWLLDHAGFRGALDNGIGMHERQALVLTNPGRRDGQSIVSFAARIQANIAARFGVTLEIEPDLI